MEKNKKLLGVQYLRAIAALMVAYYHLRREIPSLAADLSFRSSSNLSMGVGIFFVISGFIMYVTSRKLSAKEFAKRRIVRIVPLYWTLTFAICVIAFLAPGALNRTDVTAEYTLKSLLFIPYHNPTQGGLFFPLLVPGWTLNYEMSFYSLFALALLAPRGLRMWIVGVVLCASVGIGIIRPESILTNVWGFYTGNWLILFAAGVLLGAIYKRLRLSRWICALLVVGGFALVLGSFPRVGGLPMFPFAGSIAIVVGAVAWEQQYGLPSCKIPLLLGDASYSIYLVHLFAFGITREIWARIDHTGAVTAVFFAAVSMLAAIALALVTYKLIEQPALRLLNGPRRRLDAQPVG